jgi:hypothetical protein
MSSPNDIVHRMVHRSVAALIAVSFFALPMFAQSAPGAPGCWPQEYSVARDDASALLTLSTPYYTVQHDLKKGGAIAAIRYTHGRAANLLARAVETRVEDEGGALFTDLLDPSPRVSHGMVGREHGSAPAVTVECGLFDSKGRASGIRLTTVYEYRWGYIKIHKEFVFPADGMRAKTLCPFFAVMSPSLTDYGYREGLKEQDGAPPFSFGSCRWGKLRIDNPSDPAVKTSVVPRYVLFADPGVEGLEWFVSSDLSPWDLAISGRRGQGSCILDRSNDPPGIAFSVCPLSLGAAAAPLKGVRAFDYYIGMSILEGHAQRPWFHTAFNRNKGAWVSAEEIKGWANAGMQTVHCHNDGDYAGDGLFWRDGSYPPYPPADMARYNEVIEGCHRSGIRVATYFSNKELHPSTKEYQDHGQEWGRKNAKGDLQHNFYRENSEFGAQMCLRSGWLEFLKLSIDRVLKNHPLDGVYYDWNTALYCLNPAHEPAEAGAGAREPGHWDIDELLDLMEWTRRRVGPNGLIIVHNTTTPMLATENFANHVVAMEWGYKPWSADAPPFQDLPLEWSFVGARSRGVISYGHIDGQAPRRLHKLFAMEALLSGVTPWPASPETFDLFPILKPLGELETYRFADWRQKAVTVSGARCAAALYSRPGECYAVLANLDKDAGEIRCVVNPAILPCPLPSLASARLLGDGGKNGDEKTLDVGQLTRDGVTIALPADTVRLLHLR